MKLLMQRGAAILGIVRGSEYGCRASLYHDITHKGLSLADRVPGAHLTGLSCGTHTHTVCTCITAHSQVTEK